MRFNSKEATEDLPSQKFTMGCLDREANSAVRQHFVYEGYRSILYFTFVCYQRRGAVQYHLYQLFLFDRHLNKLIEKSSGNLVMGTVGLARSRSANMLFYRCSSQIISFSSAQAFGLFKQDFIEIRIALPARTTRNPCMKQYIVQKFSIHADYNLINEFVVFVC